MTTTNNRQEIIKSQWCGCFYCLEIFRPFLITEWVDQDEQGVGQTALCPYCGIDSVLADDEFITKETLEQLNEQYFKTWK